LEPRQYVAAVRRRWAWILVTGLLGAAAATTISTLAPVSYASGTSLYFGVRSVTGSADLAAGSLIRGEILPTITETARSSAVLGEVIRDLRLDTTPERLSDRIDVAVAKDTAVLEIDVSAPTAREAALLARGIAASVGRHAVELYPDRDGGSLLEVTTLVPAREPQFQSSPNTRVNTALGLVGGIGAGALLSGLGALAGPRVPPAADHAPHTTPPLHGSL
jgi:capsular polysaccharide biosynthesis protein